MNFLFILLPIYCTITVFEKVADELFRNLKVAVAELQNVERKVRMSDRKVFGWSLKDCHYGELISRIDNGIIRINQYLNGEFEALPN